MNCQEFKKIIDSYLSDELLVETNHDVLRHLESCSGCRKEIAARKEFRAKVIAAIRNASEFQIDPAFSRRLAADLRNAALRPTFFERIASYRSSINSRVLAVGFASILIVVLGTLLYVRNLTAPNKERTTNHDSRPIFTDGGMPDDGIGQAIQASWNELAHEAVGDHKNCAVQFHLLEKPVSLDVAAKKYGAFNKDFEKVVISALRNSNSEQDKNVAEAELLEAHSCIFAGRRFTHIVLREKGEVVSVLVADSDLPIGINVINAGQFDGRLNVAGFRAGNHAVFVVSALSGSDNSTIAETISQPIRAHLKNLGT